jgi:DHA1 family multidrug resistance protein-like MFS transporter
VFSLRRLVPDFSPVASSPGLVTLLLVSGALQVAASTVSPILPLFIQSISPNAALVGSTTGLILGLAALAAALSAAGLGRVSFRIGYERTLTVCLAGAVLIFLPQAFVRSPWQLLALRMAGGALIGGAEPSVNALIATRARRGRQGIVFGLNSSVNSAGAAVGPMIGAFASAAFGYAAAFLSGAVILALSTIASRRLRVRRG